MKAYACYKYFHLLPQETCETSLDNADNWLIGGQIIGVLKIQNGHFFVIYHAFCIWFPTSNLSCFFGGVVQMFAKSVIVNQINKRN